MRPALSIAVVLLVSAVTGSAALAGTDLAANESGDQVLLHRVLGQANRPLFAGLRAPGGAFGPLRRVAPPGPISYQKVALDSSGGAVAAWITFDRATVGGAVSAAVRVPGQSFGASRVLAGQAGDQLTLATNARGDSLVAWRGLDGSIEYSSRPAGGEFTPARALPWKTWAVTGLSIDEAGEALLLWKPNDGTGTDTPLVASVRPPAGEFSAPHPIQGVPTYAYPAFASSLAGGALIAWTQQGSIMAEEREPGGDFGAPFEVAAATSSIRDMALASSGAAAVAFGNTSLSVTARDPGGSFDAPQAVAPLGRDNSARIAVNDRGDVAVALGSRPHLIRAAYRASGGLFSAPVVLAAARPFAPGGPDAPSVAIDGAGRATAAWEHSSGSVVKTLVRDFDGSSSGATVVVDSVPSHRQERPRATCTAGRDPIVRRSRSSTIRRSGGTLYGCLLTRGAPVSLNTDDEDPFPPSTMALAGPLVAYAIDFSGHGTEGSDLRVTDLRDEYYGLNRDTPLETRGSGELAAARLRANGAVAWISCPTREVSLGFLDRGCKRPGGWRKHLFAWGSHVRKRRLLDAGRAIDPRSLRLHGSLLSWRHGTKLRHARLR